MHKLLMHICIIHIGVLFAGSIFPNVLRFHPNRLIYFHIMLSTSISYMLKFMLNSLVTCSYVIGFSASSTSVVCVHYSYTCSIMLNSVSVDKSMTAEDVHYLVVVCSVAKFTGTLIQNNRPKCCGIVR